MDIAPGRKPRTESAVSAILRVWLGGSRAHNRAWGPGFSTAHHSHDRRRVSHDPRSRYLAEEGGAREGSEPVATLADACRSIGRDGGGVSSPFETGGDRGGIDLVGAYRAHDVPPLLGTPTTSTRAFDLSRPPSGAISSSAPVQVLQMGEGKASALRGLRLRPVFTGG